MFSDRRTARTVIIAVALIVGVGVGAWVGTRALAAKNSLESAQVLIGDLQTKVTTRDFAGAEAAATQIKKDTANAVSLRNEPIWCTAEFVPVSVSFQSLHRARGPDGSLPLRFERNKGQCGS